eukprot:3541057-Rhodomonas_salina.3
MKPPKSARSSKSDGKKSSAGSVAPGQRTPTSNAFLHNFATNCTATGRFCAVFFRAAFAPSFAPFFCFVFGASKAEDLTPRPY